MFKTITLAGLLLLFAVSAKAEPKKVACPVIPGQMVDVKEATAHHMYADYKGHRYYFCCVSCPEAFRKNPARYAKSSGAKAPKKNKKGSH